MTDQHTQLRMRLGFTVVGIDAGRFREPGDAVADILDVLASVHPPHREQLTDWLRSIGYEAERDAEIARLRTSLAQANRTITDLQEHRK